MENNDEPRGNNQAIKRLKRKRFTGTETIILPNAEPVDDVEETTKSDKYEASCCEAEAVSLDAKVGTIAECGQASSGDEREWIGYKETPELRRLNHDYPPLRSDDELSR